jgi:predicted tellurium resistance membrane protein TerC
MMTTEIFFSFITLSLLEIVLGIDNLIFIALVVQKLPKTFQAKARYIGLVLALLMRIGMMLGMAWIMSLTKPLFSIFSFDISFRDLLLLAGGLFLIFKSTLEMHADIVDKHEEKDIKVRNHFIGAVIQIILIDIVFSFDSVITAIGMTTNIPVIVAAMTVAMLVMLMASGFIAGFLKDHPTFKMLALSFILMIGTLLIAEGLHFHVPRGYIYFAFSFSIFVETMNTPLRRKAKRQH